MPCCENCGIQDDLQFFTHLLGGITLCDDCVTLPVNQIKKRGESVKWVRIGGEYFPKDYPVVKKAEKKNG
jgi:hypothetical protein